MSEFRIEKGVDIPHKGKYPFAKMEIGDSFIVSAKYSAIISNRVRNAANRWAKRQKPVRKFELRKTGEVARIWRIE